MAFMSRMSDSTSANLPGVLVTGGSGFIGQKLVRALSPLTRPVVSMYHLRLPEPLPNVYPVCSDMSSPELLAAPLRGIQTVVHLAWDGGLAGPTENACWDLATPEKLSRNIQLLRNLLEAMERANVQRIIFVSAIGASRLSTVPFLMEKYLAEFLILNSQIKEKIIVRSSVIFGGNIQSDKFVRTIARVMKYPFYPVPNVKKTIAPIAVDDLVGVLTDLCSCKLKEPMAILDVAGGEAYRVEEIFRLIAEKIVGGGRIPVGGALGNSLVPLFDRERRHDPKGLPRIKHFLAVGGSAETATTTGNQLLELLPRHPAGFREAMNVDHRTPASVKTAAPEPHQPPNN